MIQPDSISPARPRVLKTSFERSGQHLELRCRNPQWGGGCFLVLWLIGWTVGCVFLAGMVIREPRLFSLLFAIPFWASWVFVFCMVVKMFFSREQLVLDHQGANFQSRAVLPLHRRFIPLSEIYAFDVSTKVVDSESGRTQPGLEMRTAGQSLRFLQGGSLQELQWLCRQLNEHLESLKQAVAYVTAGESGAAPPSVTPLQLASGESRLLTTAAVPIAAPSDSRWLVATGSSASEWPDDLRFVQSGRLAIGTLGGLLFTNLFWNGGVSVFVAVLLGLAPIDNPPVGPVWWGLFFFLIPFEAIGLAMFVGLLATLLDPFRRTSWTFARYSIHCRWTWLGIGPAWHWPVERLSRIEIRRNDLSAKHSLWASLKTPSSPVGEGAADYRLLFIDPANTEVCSFDALTEGEARWMGDMVLRQRREWFG